MMISNVRCPGNCLKKDKDGKYTIPGYLVEVKDGSSRIFCNTNGCRFAFIDEHKKEHWVGGEVVFFKIPEATSEVSKIE